MKIDRMFRPHPLLLTLALFLAACAPGNGLAQPPAPTPTPLPPETAIEQPTYSVQRGDVTRELVFTARVAPAQEARLFFRADGYLNRLAVQRGDAVKAGDTLAELALGDLQRQLDAARLDWEQAQIESTRAISSAQLTLQDRQLALERARANAPDPALLRAEIALQSAQETLTYAQDEYNKSLDRSWDSEDQRRGYANQVAQAQRGLAIAQADLAAAERERNYTLRQLALAVAQAELDGEIALDGPDPRLGQKIQQLEEQLAERRLVAPFDGVALALAAAPGDRVDAYAPVITVGDPAELELRADLAAEQVNELQVGQSVTLLPSGAGAQPFTGSIRQLPYGWGGDAEENDRATHIAPGPQAPALTLGALLQATVILEQHSDALWLPPAAIQEFRGRSFVFVQDPDGAQRRVDVTLGIESETRVEILAGLEEGQVVVVP